jgi:FKBP-type peptidyl-prolyl cis-trans isomerase SlyD
MKIEKHKVVTVTYDLRTESHESQIIESATEERPLSFIFGTEMMLPAFEANLAGKEQGDNFQFMLSSAEAYGEASEKNIIDLPRTAFEVEGKVEEGLLVVDNIISLQDPQGNVFDGRVAEIKGDIVTMDFNHPMAGKDLYFTGRIIGVRDATAEELDHGHVH